MRVSLHFNFYKEDDGFEGSATFDRENIEDLYELGQFLSQAVQGAGFTYVKDVGFLKDSGDETWGEGGF